MKEIVLRMVDKWTQYELIYQGIENDVNEIVKNEFLSRGSLQESNEGNSIPTNLCAFRKNSSSSIVINEEFMGSCLLEYSSAYLNLFLLEQQEQQLGIVAGHFASTQTIEDQKMTKKIVFIGWVAFLEIYIHIAQIKDRLPAELVENVSFLNSSLSTQQQIYSELFSFYAAAGPKNRCSFYAAAGHNRSALDSGT
ncbi:unnamed protein product [Rodentolepis nana]|uniref:Uncharacterized protein n=1 Tax=Rodentolepis nana TaxID=102285 RepID=A0A0R3TX70_RODNA|nr:unnamed protein product [Rodentolepis nana]